MPIWLRNFTFNKMKAHFEKEAESLQKSSQTNASKSSKISKPNIKPSYTTKPSNK